MRLVKQSVLFFREGNSDKTYEIDLCDTGNDTYVVNFRYGKRGANLKEGSKTPVPVSLTEAQKIFDAVESEKLGKGYTADASGISSIPAAAPFVLEYISISSADWLNMPSGRNKAILQRLHNAANGQKDNVRGKWKLSRIIWKAGEYKIAAATPYIIKLFNSGDALQQYISCWALSRTGGNDAANALQSIFKSFPSQRVSRLAGAGLMNVLDGLAKEQHVLYFINSLPEDFKAAINNQHPTEIKSLAIERIGQLQQSHSWLETLYLISLERKWLRPVVKQILLSLVLKPGYFKHLRTIYKWSELLDDFEVLGLISCRFEREPQLFTHYLSSADRQSIKTYVQEAEDYVKLSVELAKTNTRLAYSNKTRWYLHRRSLRRLYMLGNAENTDYVKLATAILIAYNKTTDEKEFYSEFGYSYVNNRYERTETRFPASAQAVYLHQILSGDNAKLKLVAGHRWQIVNEVMPRSSKNKSNNEQKRGGFLKMFTGLFGKKKAVPLPVESIPEPVIANETGTPFLHLWNKLPQAYVQLLMDGQLDEIHEFAKNYLTKHPEYNNIIEKLDVQACKKLLGSSYNIPVSFGLSVVEKKYNQPLKDIGLVVALLNSNYEPARQKGKHWAESDTYYFFNDIDFIVNLLFAKHDDVRNWGDSALKGKVFSGDIQKLVTGKALALLISATTEDYLTAKVIKEGTGALSQICIRELEDLNPRILTDLLQHSLPEVLLFGLRILNMQKSKINVQELPDEFIVYLLGHHYEPVRNEGIQLLNIIPTDALQKKSNIILNSCISTYTGVRKAIAPVVAKLAAADPPFGNKAASELMPFLLRKEKSEGLHEDLSRLLCNELSGYLQDANKETALNLLYSNYVPAQNVGVVILEKYTQPSQLTIPQVIALGAHENLNVREWCWKFYENEIARIKYEKEAAVRLLESKWSDTRIFARSYFKENFEEKDWDSDTLISMADSVKPDTEAFARELITKYFQSDSGEIYLLKLSQHPREKMQLFVTNYLERYAANDAGKLKSLEFYFRSVLTRVNKGRIVKNRVFSFLLMEGRKSEAAAVIVNSIVADVSATAAIEDKAKCIEILAQLKSVYAVETPLEILPVTEKTVNTF